MEASDAFGVRCGRLEQRVEPAQILAQELLRTLEQVLPGACGQGAHGLVAEDRLEHPLADVPPATTASVPVRPPV